MDSKFFGYKWGIVVFVLILYLTGMQEDTHLPVSHFLLEVWFHWAIQVAPGSSGVMPPAAVQVINS